MQCHLTHPFFQNNLARRKQKTVNQAITSFFQPTSKLNNANTPTTPALNETFPNPSTCKMAKSMMLRRHSANGTELPDNGLPHSMETNGAGNAASNNYHNHSLPHSAIMTNGGDSSLNDTNGSLNTPNSTKKKYNHKLMSILMKTTCPKYFQIPNSSRKRILRFLCDNGWIDVS